jgi:hypothetical protein
LTLVAARYRSLGLASLIDVDWAQAANAAIGLIDSNGTFGGYVVTIPFQRGVDAHGQASLKACRGGVGAFGGHGGSPHHKLRQFAV